MDKDSLPEAGTVSGTQYLVDKIKVRKLISETNNGHQHWFQI